MQRLEELINTLTGGTPYQHGVLNFDQPQGCQVKFSFIRIRKSFGQTLTRASMFVAIEMERVIATAEVRVLHLYFIRFFSYNLV